MPPVADESLNGTDGSCQKRQGPCLSSADLLQDSNASVKEMECASVAYVASLFNIPLVPVKV